MNCLQREGKRQCSWWVNISPVDSKLIMGLCVNPNVSTEVKKVCTGKLERK
jgi:hypothetical protein